MFREREPIRSAALTVTTPIVGEPADKTAGPEVRIGEDSHFRIRKTAAEGSSGERDEVYWAETDEPSYYSGTFEENKKYGMYAVLVPDQGYRFAEDVSLTVNGEPIREYKITGTGDDQTLQLIAFLESAADSYDNTSGDGGIWTSDGELPADIYLQAFGSR